MWSRNKRWSVNWKDWVIVLLVAFTAGWMLFRWFTRPDRRWLHHTEEWRIRRSIRALVNSGQGSGNRAAFHFNEIHLRWIWIGCFNSLSLFCVWLFVGAYGTGQYMYYGFVVFTDWNNYKSNCPDPASDANKIIIIDVTSEFQKLSNRFTFPNEIICVIIGKIKGRQ